MGVLLVVFACGEGSGTDIRTTAGPTRFAGSSAHSSMGPVYLSTSDGALGTTPATEIDLDVFESPVGCPDPSADEGTGGPIRWLRLSVLTVDPRPLTAGTYDLPANDPTSQTAASLQEPEGLAVRSVFATQGHIQLDRIDPETEGSVELTLVDGTQLSGSFRATPCRRVCIGPGPDGGYVPLYCDP
jgi:hypothetical protein